MEQSPIQSLRLGDLHMSESNIRKASGSPQAMAELKASLRTHGLLENLVVRTVTNAQGQDVYFVVAGSRRLAALRELIKDGDVTADTLIPCRVLGKEESSEELSLAENVVREDMHPADQVEAFANLIGAGATVTDIAHRFGVSERFVQQRLRLGTVAPSLLQAFRKNQIGTEAMMAFTVSSDHKRQVAAYKMLKGSNYSSNAFSIKRILNEERVAADSSLARYVGLKAYKAAGGTLTEDLFAGQGEGGVWFNDAQILHDLAHKKLAKAARSSKKSKGYKWLECHPELSYQDRDKFDSLQPPPAALTDKERTKKEQLEKQLEESDDFSVTWQVRSALREIELDAIKRGTHTKEQKAVTGVIVTLDYAGKVEILKGMVKPEDKRAAAKLEGSKDSTTSTITDPDAKTRKRVGISKGLADDLRDLRTNVVKAHMARSFPLAFDLAVFQFARSAFEGSWSDDALDISLNATLGRPAKRYMNQGVKDDPYGDMDSGGREFERIVSRLELGWTDKDLAPLEAFDQFRKLTLKTKQALFAAAVAKALNGQLGWEKTARPQIELTVEALRIDFAKDFRPGRLYWEQLPKSKLLEVAREVLGADWASARGKSKKAQLVKDMTEAFAAGKNHPIGVTSEGRKAALAWVPPGFEPKVPKGEKEE